MTKLVIYLICTSQAQRAEPTSKGGTKVALCDCTKEELIIYISEIWKIRDTNLSTNVVYAKYIAAANKAMMLDEKLMKIWDEYIDILTRAEEASTSEEALRIRREGVDVFARREALRRQVKNAWKKAEKLYAKWKRETESAGCRGTITKS